MSRSFIEKHSDHLNEHGTLVIESPGLLHCNFVRGTSSRSDLRLERCKFLTICRESLKAYQSYQTWVTRNPDGHFERPVIGINNEWPVPLLNITKGENVVVNMHNQVCNENLDIQRTV